MIVVMLLVLIGGVVLGRWLDPEWQVRQMRNVMRKNYVIAGILSKDRRTIQDRAVLVEGDAINFAGSLWVCERDRMYRKDKPEHSISFKDNLKYKEGVPYIFLDSTTLRPVDFVQDENPGSKADAVGSVYSAYLANQIAKAFAAVKRNEQMLLASVVLGVLIIIGLVFIYGNIDATKADTLRVEAKVDALQSDMNVLRGKIPQTGNNSIIIQG